MQINLLANAKGLCNKNRVQFQVEMTQPASMLTSLDGLDCEGDLCGYTLGKMKESARDISASIKHR